ncbi:MAG: GNAT family N-acetyltransferase [Terriglobia bacterium]
MTTNPIEYVTQSSLKDGTPVTVRPIVPEDEPLLAKFHQTLSDHSVYMRYFHILPLGNRVEHKRLANICHADQDQEVVLVAEGDGPEPGGRKIIGVGRWNKFPGTPHAEIAVLVSDEFQNRGVGTELFVRLIEFARVKKLQRLFAKILPENLGMQHVARKLGFQLTRELSDPIITATLDL